MRITAKVVTGLFQLLEDEIPFLEDELEN
jgi:hypothetical protein